MGMTPKSPCQLAQPHGSPPVDAQIKPMSHLPADQNDALKAFSSYCSSFYNSSLVITSSSSLVDQDKNVGHAMANDRKVSQGKIVLEALDRIGAMKSAAQSCSVEHPVEIQNGARESLGRLQKEHELAVECHGDLLQECGLSDVSIFIDSTTERPISYEQYTQMRDAIRRHSHKLAMMQRQSSLYVLLSESEQDSNSESTTPEKSMALTQLTNVQHAITTTEQFVKKYCRNIGSHSFLAGLHRLIHSQIHSKPNNDVVQWNFLGSVLTEACHSNNEGDTQAYALEATKVLFSFLTWVKSDDVEGGHGSNVTSMMESFNFDEANQNLEVNEPTLSFVVDKYISNPNLRRILAVLPNPKELDARATGSIEVLSVESMRSSECVQLRMNVDGHLDEAWPWWQFCNVL